MSTTPTTRIEQQLLRLIAWSALGIGVFLLVILGFRIFDIFANPDTRFAELGLVLKGAATPVAGTLPEHIVEISTVRDSLVVSHLPLGIRWLLAAQTVLQATLGLGMCLATFTLTKRLLAGKPFARSVIWTLATVAVAVLLSGAIAPFLQAIAEAETLKFISDGTFVPALDTGFSADGALIFGMKIDLTPFAITIGLGALITAFEAGARLQRDTEGLI